MNTMLPALLLMLLMAGVVGRMLLRGSSAGLWLLLLLGAGGLLAAVVFSLGQVANWAGPTGSYYDIGGWLDQALTRAGMEVLWKFGLMAAAVVAALAVACAFHLAARNARQQQEYADLGAERDHFKTLVDSMDSIIWEFDASDLRVLFISRQARRILGYDANQWLENAGFRASILHPDDRWAIPHCRQMIQLRKPYEFDYRVIAKDGRTVWLRESGRILPDKEGAAGLVRGLLQDITALKDVSEEMKRLNQSLLEASRHAGMAEVATSVLHNVGNLLNSISVSSTVVRDRIKGSKAASLRQAALMMRGHNGHLAEFLTQDPKGRLIPEYLDTVTDILSKEHEEVISELSGLSANIEHVKEIVATQQSYATSSGVFEFLHPGDLADDALRMNGDLLQRSRVRYTREYGMMAPRVKADRHKVLQILVNLIQNAMQAMDASGVREKHLTVRVAVSADKSTVGIRVSDNGIGIAPEHLAEIFRHGFTTKKNGHGFGLHGAANFAKELNGQLTVHSDGPGKGAAFTLFLPTQ